MAAFLDNDQFSARNGGCHSDLASKRRQAVLAATYDDRWAMNEAEIVAPIGPIHNGALLALKSILSNPLSHSFDCIGEGQVREPVVMD
jgi:hypothetical protein